ncbi:Queuine tRNA-ribosyltransferase [Giardia muris]|uniref:Queuine tRNA-ribosyltransferase n=1 Tax=Giardia muris TaxID=5742 RepID=A0A4Z1SRL2_GIAMU|nr:Queuine tRNA-ribosyltransferase [Giardia muris]|eukprot:TNJ28370.1 Queuine tRNA-ribosyltransferase [Giardia muris]
MRVYLQSILGAVGALPPTTLDLVDPERRLGLYVSVDAETFRAQIQAAGSLASFTGQSDRSFAMGPLLPTAPVQLKSKKNIEATLLSSGQLNSVATPQTFGQLLTECKPELALIPNPVLLPRDLTHTPLKWASLYQHSKALSYWVENLHAPETTLAVGVSMDLVAEYPDQPKKELQEGCFADIKAASAIFTPYPHDLRHLRERFGTSRLVAACGPGLASLLRALSDGATDVITNLVADYAERGIAITLPLSIGSTTAEPPLKQESEAKPDSWCCRVYLSEYSRAKGPLLNGCPCDACKRPLAYLRHLYATHELTGRLLLCIHNTTWLVRLLVTLEERPPNERAVLLRTLLEAIMAQNE